MSENPLREAFETLRARLYAGLDEQLTALEERQAETLVRAREAAEAEADARWVARLEEARAEGAVRLESELAAAAAVAEGRLASEAARLRTESEQALAEVRNAAGREWQQKLDGERARAEQERLQIQQQLDNVQSEVSRGEGEQRRLQQEVENLQEQARRTNETIERERGDLAAERQRLHQAHEDALQAVGAERDAARAELERERATASELAVVRAELERERARASELEAAHNETVAALEDATTSLNRARTELETTRRDAAAAQSAERERIQALGASLDEARAALRRTQEEARSAAAAASERQQQRAATETDARSTERQWRVAIVERMLRSVKAIGEARSLSDTLSALVTAAAAEAPRSALFIVNGPRLQGWRAHGFGSIALSSMQSTVDERGAIGEAARRGEAVSTTSAPAPGFAALPHDRVGLAMPVTVGGRTVAVLYADDGSAGEPEAPASWPEAVQLLGRHASAWLAHLTALRTAQAMRAAPASAAAPQPPSTHASEDDTSAKRYARLLVSEIKLYNEGAVRVGREKRDLMQRLRSEIERARRLYEERVPEAAGARSDYFQQELVQTLADGDPALLGEPV